ncbi:MAG: arylsulfatase [Bryobacterales bacterium]|nr:arylsulfatase [Bryobacterales bacterium]
MPLPCSNRHLRPAIGHLLPALLLAAGCTTTPVDSRPNIILVMTDDQGYGEVGAHGNSMIQTPNLDALHAESVRLTNFHVDPTCSPTRAALVTGRYSSRTGVWHTIMGRSIVHREETTFADVLSEAGYATGFFGKWHLGDNAPYRPMDRGFQEAIYHGGGGIGQTPDYWGNDYFDDTYWHNGEPTPYTGYCTDVFFDRAMRFIENKASAGERPFFVYLATNAPHGPFLVDESYSAPYAEKGVPSPMDKFYGMIENIDDNMGRLIAKLDELGIAANTLLIFMTDNGSAAGVTNTHPTQRVGSRNAELLAQAAEEEAAAAWQGFNAGMRGRKGSEYDGGHRVPFFVRWPGGDLGSPRDVANLAAHIDVLPTLADAAGTPRREDLDWDGTSLLPLLRGGAWDDRTLTVHSQRIRFPERWRKSAVMTEQYRLVNGRELYDIHSDPGQLTDIAAENPETVASLRTAYDAWWDRIDDRFEQHVYLDIGSDAENPARITSHDWLPPDDTVQVPWNQGQVARAPAVNGTWNIQVTQAGSYEFDLYQRDKPANFAIDAETATLRIGDLEETVSLEPGASSATIAMELPEGKTTMDSRFTASDGTERGAFFVYAKRL